MGESLTIYHLVTGAYVVAVCWESRKISRVVILGLVNVSLEDFLVMVDVLWWDAHNSEQ